MKKTSYNDSLAADTVYLADYARTLQRSWRLIVVVTLIVFGIGIMYAALQSPVYRADSLIQIETSSVSPTETESLGRLAAIFDSKVKGDADAEMELIRSRLVVSEAVKKLHLEITAHPYYVPVIGRILAEFDRQREGQNSLLERLGFLSHARSITVTRFGVPEDYLEKDFSIEAGPDSTFSLFDPKGNLLAKGRVGVETTGRLGSGDVHLLVSRLVGANGNRFVVRAQSMWKTIEGLQMALAISERKNESGMIGVSLEGRDPKHIAEVLNTIAQQYVLQHIAYRSSQAEQSLSFLEAQLPSLRAKMEQAEMQYNAFRNRTGSVDLDLESRTLLQQIVEVETYMRGLQDQREDLLTRYKGGFPLLASINSKIALAQKERDALVLRVQSLPDSERVALGLARDVRVSTELYTNLLNNAQQLRVIKAGSAGNARIVDYAMPPEDAVKPNWMVTVAMCAILGPVLGAGLALLRRGLYPGLERSTQIQQAFGIGVVAVIPHSNKQARLEDGSKSKANDKRVLALDSPTDAAVEGIRGVRTAMEASKVIGVNNISMVTSSSGRAGKSFLAVNLATVLAVGGKRVLLIDGDIRNGKIHACFNVPEGPGFSNLLQGGSLSEALRRDVVTGLDLIPRGTQTLYAADLLMGPRLGEILSVASDRYDLVVIDSPPILAVTDSTIIGKHCGTTMIAVRHGRHPAAEVSEALSRLATGGVEVTGILFTDVPSGTLGYGSKEGKSPVYGV
jgi:tyrosine-protein kinase Etk/Wzc